MNPKNNKHQTKPRKQPFTYLFTLTTRKNTNPFIYRIFYEIYQHVPLYQRRAASLYKKDGTKNKPLPANPYPIQNRSQIYYRNRKSQ